jgi:hypothetical protein
MQDGFELFFLLLQSVFEVAVVGVPNLFQERVVALLENAEDKFVLLWGQVEFHTAPPEHILLLRRQRAVPGNQGTGEYRKP